MTSTTSTIETKKDIIVPSTELYSDEPPLETDFHLRQIILLIQCLEWYWRQRNDFFATGNLTIYYSPRQKKSEDFRGPDFFVVLGTEKRSRKSWVVWQEGGKYPNIIVEILSATTANTDRETKKQIYQDIFRTPNYFWFDPDSLEFAGFDLIRGKYQPITPNEQGWMFSSELGLYLGIREGKLRFFTPDGELVPTPEETAQEEQHLKELALQEAEYERQQKEIVQRQVQKLAEKLRELKINLDDIN